MLNVVVGRYKMSNLILGKLIGRPWVGEVVHWLVYLGSVMQKGKGQIVYTSNLGIKKNKIKNKNE